MSRLRGFDTYMEYERGFHGWLFFFFVTACIGQSVRTYTVYSLVRLVYQLSVANDSWAAILAAVCAAAIILALWLGELYGLVLFAKGDQRTPAFWSAFFLVSLVGEVLFFLAVAFRVSIQASEPFTQSLADRFTFRWIEGLLLMAVWAGYWMRSKRVRATYGYAGLNRPSAADTMMNAPAA